LPGLYSNLLYAKNMKETNSYVVFKWNDFWTII